LFGKTAGAHGRCILATWRTVLEPIKAAAIAVIDLPPMVQRAARQ